MPPTLPRRERSIADTGFFVLPVELPDAHLTPVEFAVYAVIAREADKLSDPPEAMDLALMAGTSVDAVRAALRVLESRCMLVIRSATDWELTEPSSWTSF